MIGMARGAVYNLARNAASRRGLATSRALRSSEVHPGYKNIKPKQEKFLAENDTPVHLKGGPLDTILYTTTMALCVGAVGWDCYFYYQMAQK